MRKHSLIYILFITILISSCKKDCEILYPPGHNNPYHFLQYHLQDTLSGTVYVDCNQHPDANRSVTIMIISADIDLLNEDSITTVITDSLGHFSYPISYSVTSTETPWYFIQVDNQNSSQPTYKILNYPVHSPFNIVTHDTAHLVVKIIATNAYTNHDTLYYEIGNSSPSSLAGPFNTGVINIVNVPQWFYDLDTSHLGISWCIGYRNLWTSGNINVVYSAFAIKHLTCSPADTVTINMN